MWNLASSAGTGLAVAGLSATYYALAKKSEMDRGQRRREGGIDPGGAQGDQDLTKQLSATQLLLKKEFDSLKNKESGLGAGLNYLDKEHSSTIVESVPSFYSGLDLRAVVSRANSLRIQTIYERSKEKSRNSETLDSEMIALGENEISKPEKVQRSYQSKATGCDFTEEDISVPTQDNVKVEKPKNTEKRSKSPIICYKNPGFGYRYACKSVAETPSLAKLSMLPSSKFSSFNKQDIREESLGFSLYSQQGKRYQDSTQFIFPPVLSESKLSLCGNEDCISSSANEPKSQTLIDQQFNEVTSRRTSSTPSFDETDTFSFDSNLQLDHVKKYNDVIEVTQNIRNTDNSRFLEDTPLPVTLETPDNESSTLVQPSIVVSETSTWDKKSNETIIEQSANHKNSSEVIFQLKNVKNSTRIGESCDCEGDNVISENMKAKDGAEDQDSLTTGHIGAGDASRSSMVGTEENSDHEERENKCMMEQLPENTLIDCSSPNYEPNSTNLLIFMAITVIACGVMGRFFIFLAEWLDLEENLDNPYASIDH